MVGKFWETVAGELAKKWTALGTSAAAVVWAAGLAAWALGHEDGLDRINQYVKHLDAITQVCLVVGAIALVVASAFVVGLLQPAVLRLLQGDVPVDNRLAKWKRARVSVRRERRRGQLAQLQTKGLSALSAAESRRAARLDAQLHRLPARALDERLTALGNLMSASEARLRVRYGLHSGVVWPALWLVLPELTRTELQAARSSVDGAVRAVIWGVLTAVWSVWTMWALVVALPVSVAAYMTLRRRAEAFGHISEATFAVHRFDLYTKLGFPLPATPDEDRIVGEQATEYLWRGTLPLGWLWKPTAVATDASAAQTAVPASATPGAAPPDASAESPATSAEQANSESESDAAS